MDKIKYFSGIKFLSVFLSLLFIIGISAMLFSISASADSSDVATFANVTVPSDNRISIDNSLLPTLGGYAVIGSGNVSNYTLKKLAYNYGEGTVWLSCYDSSTGEYYYSRYLQATIHNGTPSEYIYHRYSTYNADQQLLIYDTDYINGKFDLSKLTPVNYYELNTSGNQVLFSCASAGVTDYSVTFYDKKLNLVSLGDLSKYSFYWLYSPKFKWVDAQYNGISLSKFFGGTDTSGYVDGNIPGYPPKAEFLTCDSYTRDDGGLPLWFKDFTADGLQYPMFSYYISDNGNKHRYQLRLSYSSSQAQYINTVFGNVNENNISEQEKKMRDLALFLKGNLPVGSTNYEKFMALRPYFQLILKKPEYLSFNESFTLNANAMNFDNSLNDGNKVYTICLSDYSDIIAYYIYRAELVDMQTSQVLDTTYFCSNKTYHKGDSGTGAKIYDYGDDYDGMIEDIKNNTPSITPGIDNKFSTTGDIINMKDDDYLSGLKIDNIFSVLGQSARSIGAFFQACFNIVPPAILSILLSTMSLLIVLRVLGR